MFQLPNFRFDRPSFWMGFAAATLFWWLMLRLRSYVPALLARVRRMIEDYTRRSQTGVEIALRREVQRRAQRAHLAATIFALDEILVEPHLLIPPPTPVPGLVEDAVETMAGNYLPYLPDWPELIAPLGAPVITLAQAFASLTGPKLTEKQIAAGEQPKHDQYRRPLVVIGQPGSGKTVALARLADQIARQDVVLGPLQTAMPLYLHAADLPLNAAATADPLPALYSAVSGQVGVVWREQLLKLIRTLTLRDDPDRPLVLILDGLNELPPETLSVAVDYLAALLAAAPHLYLVTAAAPEYLDGLSRIRALPMALAPWNNAQREFYTLNFSDRWLEWIQPREKYTVDPDLIRSWLIGTLGAESPLELTLKCWGAWAGDVPGAGLVALLESALLRYLPSAAQRPALDAMGAQFVAQGQAWMDLGAMSRILTSALGEAFALPLEADPAASAPGMSTPDLLPPESPAEMPAPHKKSRKKGAAEVLITPGDRMIDALLQAGVLVLHGGSRVGFGSAIFAGLTAAGAANPETLAPMTEQPHWSPRAQTLRFSALASPDGLPWAEVWLFGALPPLFQPVLTAARWLSEAPPNAAWRVDLMRTLAGYLQQDSRPVGLRLRAAAALVASRDAAAAQLFKQLLKQGSDQARKIALMGLGALGAPSSTGELIEHLTESDLAGRAIATLCVAALPGETAQNMLVEILLQGEEELRRAAAEVVILHRDGRKIIEEAAAFDDVLVRRASVYGLLQFRQPWARALLENLAIEDSQWVVRNAAGQALENFDRPAMLQPVLPPPAESAWLLAFAARAGQGIRPDDSGETMLWSAVEHGKDEEKIAAMTYLHVPLAEGSVGRLYNLIYGTNSADVREAAYETLMRLAAEGYVMPSPMQFGLG